MTSKPALNRGAYESGAAAQREADFEAFKRWCSDLELPFGTDLTSWHAFGVAFADYLRGEPLAKP